MPRSTAAAPVFAALGDPQRMVLVSRLSQKGPLSLTDLADGSPLEQAQVSLTVRPRGGEETIAQTTAKVGKVTGIYVADLIVPRAGEFDIEVHIKNAKVDERQLLSDFKVE